MKSLHKVVTQLRATTPAVEQLFLRHMADYKTLLPHVIFGDVSRFVVEMYSRPPENRDEHEDSTALLGVLEAAMKNGSPEVKDLVSTSFVENVAEIVAQSPWLRAKFGPALEAELTTILRSWGMSVD